jgi:hypothetical protein
MSVRLWPYGDNSEVRHCVNGSAVTNNYLDSLKDKLKALARQNGTNEAQEILGFFSNLLSRFGETCSYSEFEAQLSIAAAALEASPQNIRLAYDILYNVDARTTDTKYRAGKIVRGSGGSPMHVVAATLPYCLGYFVGLSIAINLIGYLIVDYWWSKPPPHWFDDIFFNPSYILATTVAFFSSLGGLLQRASVLSDLGSTDLTTLSYTTMWKPWRASVIAAGVYFALKAKIVVTPKIDDADVIFFYAAVGFLVGLSDSFAGDIFSRAQNSIGKDPKTLAGK